MRCEVEDADEYGKARVDEGDVAESAVPGVGFVILARFAESEVGLKD